MIESFNTHTPRIHPDAFVHAMACLIGHIEIGARSSIWPTVVLRGDMGRIVIGEDTSIQDGSVAHMTLDWSDTIIGSRVTVGHRVIIHGCIVEDECLIGMGSILLDNCKIGKGSLIAAGTIITARSEIPPNSVVMGAPGKIVRQVSEKDRTMIEGGWKTYVSFAKQYRGLS